VPGRKGRGVYTPPAGGGSAFCERPACGRPPAPRVRPPAAAPDGEESRL
jgi:hypothetical protein